MAKSNNNEIKARSKWTLGDIVVHIILVILSVIWVLPIAWIIMISFRGEKGQYVSTLLPKSLTLANYTKLFTDTGILNFMQMFKNTLIIAIFSCIISTAFVLAVSYCMSRMRFRLRKPFMNVEMHYHLTDGDPVAEKYYKDVWTTKVHLKKGYTSIYEFSWEDYYIYMLVHLAKHIKLGGSGIRSIIDIKIFLDKKKEELNWDYVKEELKKLHLSQFEYWMRQLSEVWFGTEKTTPLYDELTEFIVDSGTYGTIKNYHASHVVELGGKNQNLSVGKIRSKLEIIFLPYEGMQEQYLYLEKFPFLLPVAWIQRIFRTIVWRKDKITSTLQSTNIEQDRLEKVKKVMDALELFESD